MGLLRRTRTGRTAGIDLGPAHLLPAGDPGCWLVRATSTSAPAVVQLPVAIPAQEAPSGASVAAFEADPEPVLSPAAPVDEPTSTVAPPARPARARLAALTANLSV
jgi:hypothetical protein